MRWLAARPWSENRIARIQQQGATIAGWFFLPVGFIGLLGATAETIQGDHPESARVISSRPLSDEETVVVTRVALADGRIGVIQSRDSYTVSTPIEVQYLGEGNSYEEYAPMARWIGSGIAFGSGVLLVSASRASRRPASSPGPPSGES